MTPIVKGVPAPTIGSIIHIDVNAQLPGISNADILPCRAAIVTGPPSSMNGKLPVTFFPPYAAPLAGIVGDHWHNLWECPMEYRAMVAEEDVIIAHNHVTPMFDSTCPKCIAESDARIAAEKALEHAAIG